MKFIEIQGTAGKIGLSKIVLGTDHYGAAIPEKTSFDLIDRYTALGGSTLDTARLYGQKVLHDTDTTSERTIGKWLRATGRRNEVVIVTKGAHPDRRTVTTSRVCQQVIDEELEKSLEELGTDYVDVYLLHRDNPALPAGEILEMIDPHVKAGRIRAFGVSNWSCERIAQANTYAKEHQKTPIVISQIQWGLAATTPERWGDPTLLCMNQEEYAGYLQNGIPVMGFSSQGGGYYSKLISGEPLKEKIAHRYDHALNRKRLEAVRVLANETGCSPAAIALAYITSNPVQGLAVVGCSNVQQLEDCMSASDLTIDTQGFGW